VSTDALFQSLQAAKYDVAGLDTRDHLRRDYKQYPGGYGIASVYLAPGCLASLPDFACATEAFIRAAEIDFLLVMATERDEQGYGIGHPVLIF
jgi:hypothetical protein